MKFAYADPPYLNCGKLYAKDHKDHLDANDPIWHRALIDHLSKAFPDGWALSASSPSLRIILPMCPDDCRISAWVKPFAIFKPNVNPAYAWEPVIWRGGRKGDRNRQTVRDWVSANITLKRGLTGAKPEDFCHWILDILGFQDGDNLADLFPGTNAMTKAVETYKRQSTLEP